MLIHDHATVEVSEEDEAAYAFLDPDEPVRFPIENASVVINGSTATISVPRDDLVPEGRVPQPRSKRRLDRLTGVKITQKGDDGPVTISGQSTTLLGLGIATDDAQVTFTIVKSNLVVEPGEL